MVEKSLFVLQVMNEYGLSPREKRVIWDEVKGLKGNARSLRPPINRASEDYRKPPKYTYLDLLRCGGKTHRLNAKKKREEKKKKTKYRYQTEYYLSLACSA